MDARYSAPSRLNSNRWNDCEAPAGSELADTRPRNASTNGSSVSARVRSRPAAFSPVVPATRCVGWASRASSAVYRKNREFGLTVSRRNKRGQRVQIKIRGHDSSELMVAVEKRRRTRYAWNSLVVEDVRRQPNEPRRGLRLGIKRPHSRIVCAVVFRRRLPPRAVRLNQILDRRGRAVHDSGLSDPLLAVCAVGPRKSAGLVAIAHPTQSRIALEEREELSVQPIEVVEIEAIVREAAQGVDDRRAPAP